MSEGFHWLGPYRPTHPALCTCCGDPHWNWRHLRAPMCEDCIRSEDEAWLEAASTHLPPGWKARALWNDVAQAFVVRAFRA